MTAKRRRGAWVQAQRVGAAMVLVAAAGCNEYAQLGEVAASTGQNADEQSASSATGSDADTDGGTAGLGLPELDPNFEYGRDVLPIHLRWLASYDNTPEDNPISDEGAALGRLLFYDPRLGNPAQAAARSCGECHAPASGFAGGASRTKSDDVARVSMPLLNLRFYPSRETGTPAQGRAGFFWDGRAATIEEAVRSSLTDARFLGAEPSELESRLAAIPGYAAHFEAAFGHPDIEFEGVVKALAQFVRAIVSYRSAGDAIYDFLGTSDGIPDWDSTGEHWQKIMELGGSPAAMQGLQAYYGHGRCHDCHSERVPALRTTFASNGLDQNPSDPGLGAITGRREHEGLFKIPVLRNLTLRPAMMHDGRFSNLEQALEHYHGGLQPHANLHPILQEGIELQAEDTPAVTAFLNLWTDYALRDDPRFQDPFAGWPRHHAGQGAQKP